MEKVYCQSKNVQFGAFVALDHKPDEGEISRWVSWIATDILKDIVIRSLDAFQVFLKTPEDFKNMVNDPLYDATSYKPDKWTIGVKISCKDAGYGSPCKYKLIEGIAPVPIED